MPLDIAIERTQHSRRESADFDALGFGDLFSDHIFSMEWYDGAWRDARIEPYGPIALEPGTASLHYGQLIFEGLKAFYGVDGRIRLFRPDANARRFRDSCQRLCIPPLPEEDFVTAVSALVHVDRAWIPTRRGQALYIRPLLFGTETHLDVRPSRCYRFLIMTSPVREYFANGFAPIALKVEERYTRAARGGTGFAKTAGNYAASLLPTAESQRQGYHQVLWLDGCEHRYVEEVGQMNIFFHLEGRVVTPPLSGTILPGVTRDSVITLLRDRGIRVEERPIEIAEILEAVQSSRLQEAFGSGTAAVVAPIGRIGYQDDQYNLPTNLENSLARWLYDEILGIQYGSVADRHNWTRIVDPT
ncbi:MAG: branched-chain amino acid aminotransferase [Gammaproteobacteria bacterium]